MGAVSGTVEEILPEVEVVVVEEIPEVQDADGDDEAASDEE